MGWTASNAQHIRAGVPGVFIVRRMWISTTDALHHAEARAAPADVAWGRAAVLHKAKALKRGLGEETRGAEGSPSLHPARLFGPLPWAGISFSVRFVVLL